MHSKRDITPKRKSHMKEVRYWPIGEVIFSKIAITASDSKDKLSIN
jgi:hypothetical protein